jgi:glucose/arabinose dehydrogenase
VGGRALRGALGIVGLLAAACASGGGIVNPAPSSTSPAIADVVVQTGLVVPWDIAVAPDGRLFVTERPGTIDVFASTAPMAKRVVSTQIPGVRAMGEAGALGLALDPEFATNGLLYVCASRTDGADWRNQVLRYKLTGATLALDGVVLRAGPVAAGIHDACRIRFGPDRKLWIVTGDAGQGPLAQDVGSLNGKVLRMNADGTVPTDNPTIKGAATPSLVYALGLRNPGGLAFDPSTGTGYVADAGDQAQDEVDVVSASANFGWPTVSGAGGAARGFTDPAWTSGATNIAVAGAVFISGEQWGAWNGSLIVATLKDQDLRRFTVDGVRAQLHEILLGKKYGRLRAVSEGPDGSLLVATSNGNGDRIVRITPTH